MMDIKIVEVERAQTLADWTAEDEELIGTLQGNPAFGALVKKLKIQKSLLASALNSTKFDSLVEVARIQSGIFWIGYLEKLVRQEVEKKKAAKPRNPYEVEEQEFQRVMSALEIVGGKKEFGADNSPASKQEPQAPRRK